MTKLKAGLLACALAGALSVASATGTLAFTPAGSVVAGSQATIDDALVHKVQRRGGGGPRVGRGGGGPRVGRGGRGPRVGRGGRRGGRGISPGTAAAVGLGIGVLGAIAGQSAAKQRRLQIIEETRRQRALEEQGVPVYDEPRPVYRRRASSDVEYCMRRFRSYNPDTGLYRGFDGLMHPCP